MMHRHVVREVGRIEGPKVQHLLAVGVDDLEMLARLHVGCQVAAGWDQLPITHTGENTPFLGSPRRRIG